MRKPTVDWLAGLAAVGAQWRACTAATRRRSRVGLVSGGSAWATSALCKLCMMGPVLMLHGLVLLLADGTVPEPPGMARVTGGELNLKYTPESGMLLAGSQWCAGAAPDSKLLESVAPHVNATELASHETTGSGRARPRQPRKGVAASDRRAEVFRAVRERAVRRSEDQRAARRGPHERRALRRQEAQSDCASDKADCARGRNFSVLRVRVRASGIRLQLRLPAAPSMQRLRPAAGSELNWSNGLPTPQFQSNTFRNPPI